MNNPKRYTLFFLCIALVGCSTLDKAPRREEATTGLSQLELRVHHLINQYRIARNLPPLTTNRIITREARTHSRAMAQRTITFSHDGFRKRVKRISRSIRYRSAAENVAYNRGYPDCAQEAVERWLKSWHHRKNIRGPYVLTGIGVAKDPRGGYYFTQIFWR